MALQRMTIDGYGQVEINNCAFRRDGRIEAQCAPDASAFSGKKVENGMLLHVDNVKRTCSPSGDEKLPIGLVYSAEHLYDERATGLKDFALNPTDDFLPRIGYLAVGDKYTTNCISYNDTEFATEAAFISALGSYKTTNLYASVGSDGTPAISSSAPTSGLAMRVVEYTTMPDGQKAVKLQVYSC